MSVRVRLTLWYVFVLGLGLVAFGTAVFLQTRQAASASFDQTLRERALELRPYVRFTPSVGLQPGAPDEGAGVVGEAAAWIRVLDGDGRVRATEGPPLSGVPRPLLSTTRPGFAHAGNLHVFVLPVVRRGARVATVQIITTAQQVDATSQRLIASMIVVGFVVLLLATFAGLFLADRALRPVNRITRVAREIGEGDLKRRVVEELGGHGSRPFARRDEIGKLARTFDAMLERLHDADERRRQLTADAAHELSTPLTTMTTGAEIALRHPRTAEEYRDALSSVVAEGHHLVHIVDDLLLLARADAGRLPMKHGLVEVDDLCRQVVRGMAPLARDRRVTVNLELPAEPILVNGDDMRLGQVVRNLLDNALRYTPPAGTIWIEARFDHGKATRAPEVAIHIRDTGPGIPRGERERIFERFHRVVDTVRSPGSDQGHGTGSGLGLAICKAIIVAHGGWIRVEDNGSEEASRGSAGTHIVIGLPRVY